MFEMKIEGLKQLDNALKKLPLELQKKFLRAAVATSSNVIRKEVLARAPVRTGKLKNNVYRAYSKDKSDSGKATYVVGVRMGRKTRYKNNAKNRRLGRTGQTYQKDGEAFYWKFIEFGTKNFAAQPFIRPAFEAKKTEAINAIKLSLQKSIKKLERQFNR
jgi:HK97 gp10 family phage protein